MVVGDDVVTMLMVLDINKVPLPTYASVDPSRILPPLVPNSVDASKDHSTLLELTKSLWRRSLESWRSLIHRQPINLSLE